MFFIVADICTNTISVFYVFGITCTSFSDLREKSLQISIQMNCKTDTNKCGSHQRSYVSYLLYENKFLQNTLPVIIFFIEKI